MQEFIHDPSYATAVGLLKYGAQKHKEKQHEIKEPLGMIHWLSKAKNWFKGEF